MRYPNFDFKIHHSDKKSNARCGTIQTPHGEVETPNFIFCATKAAIKGVSTSQAKEENTQIILSNTYHLMLQPGSEIVKKLGGLHKMMNWHGPMFTDSGGYQIFSLGHGSVASEIKGNRGNSSNGKPKTLVSITEEGANFKSYIDGSYHLLTPEKSIQIQRDLGADLIVVLDECTAFHVDKTYTEKSMHLSHRWALRSLAEFDRGNDHSQALYGIVQGGIYDDLRKIGTDFINENDFFANAVGGSLGQNKAQMHEIVATTMNLLNRQRPTHLLGIGGVSDIFNGVECGIDTFDCVHPTRLARHGGALIPKFVSNHEKEHININNSRFRDDDTAIDPTCNCSTCKNYSKGYIHHLFRAKEIQALQLLTIHNIHFMNRLMKSIRDAIIEDRLDSEKKRWV